VEPRPIHKNKIFLHVALLLILHLDIAQEKRMLFADEMDKVNEYIMHNHFKNSITRGDARTRDFNRNEMNFENLFMGGLDDPFT
jgi:hypothetical protein